MKNKLIIIVLISCFTIGYAQNNKSVFPNFMGQDSMTISKNANWKILVKSIGDLDKDKHNDCVLILESKESILEKRCSDCKLLKNKPRIILVLINTNGKLITTIQNNNFIARGNEGGMAPYIEPELFIKNGFLTIFYQYTRGNMSYSFKYKNNDMLIVNAISNRVEAASGNYEFDTYDFKKRKIIVKKGNIAQNNEATEIIKIKKTPQKLTEFKEMYDWEVAENKFL